MIPQSVLYNYTILVNEKIKELVHNSVESPSLYNLFWPVPPGKISCTLVLCTYHAPKGALRRTKCYVPKMFIFSYLYLCYKFRSSAVVDKQ